MLKLIAWYNIEVSQNDKHFGPLVFSLIFGMCQLFNGDTFLIVSVVTTKYSEILYLEFKMKLILKDYLMCPVETTFGIDFLVYTGVRIHDFS